MTSHSYYAQNPHYLPEDFSGDVARLESAEREAGSWFDYATKPQAARYAEQMAVASAYRGAPKWDRIRDAAQREFADTTKEASALCDETVQHYLARGEVLEELADRWEALAAKTNCEADPEGYYAEALKNPVKARVLFDASKGGNVRGITEDHRYELVRVFRRNDIAPAPAAPHNEHEWTRHYFQEGVALSRAHAQAAE